MTLLREQFEKWWDESYEHSEVKQYVTGSTLADEIVKHMVRASWMAGVDFTLNRIIDKIDPKSIMKWLQDER